MKLIVSCFVFLFLILPDSGLVADVSLAGVFGDHMVLQRDQPIPVWGWADPNETVAVELAGKKGTATADENGSWMVKLDALPAGGPYDLLVAGKNKIKASDVLIGEVWLCSGQSNMAMTVARSQNFEAEKGLAALPQIRMITISKNSQPEFQDDCRGQWQVASSQTVGGFSATAWFFGRKIHEELDVPVGLINSSWGGTDIAAWTSEAAQRKRKPLASLMDDFDAQSKRYSAEQAEATYQAQLKQWNQRQQAGKTVGRKPRKQTSPRLNQNRPSNLFNGMINPLVPYGIRGAIWYQGERNSKTIPAGQLYAVQLKTLIGDWRDRWGHEFPFITVQLPNFHEPQSTPVENTGWVAVRESQLKSLQLPATGIAVTTDVGMAGNIHPTNKQAVGLRLALWALGTTYGKPIVYSGPIFSSYQYSGSNSDGKRGNVRVYFEHTGEGLEASDGGKIKGFAVAGMDQVFYEANVQIKSGMLQISSPEVPDPVAVRYNWADNPSGNLVNSAGLPAAPFRSDDWELKQ